MAYLLDANVFIQAKNAYYDFRFCPAFWDWIDSATAGGSVLSVEAIRDELIDYGDELSGWVRDRRSSLFLATSEPTLASLQTLSTWAEERRTAGRYSQAAVSEFLASGDYQLIAAAHAENHIVVTHERSKNSLNHIQIPDVCAPHGVRCISPFEMLRVENARFVLGAVA